MTTMFMIMFAAVVLLFLATAFVYARMRMSRDYSSKMYIMGGVSELFFLQALLLFTILLYRDENGIDWEYLLNYEANAGNFLVMILADLMIIETIFLIISNIVLLTKEGFALHNLLGIGFSLTWILIWVLNHALARHNDNTDATLITDAVLSVASAITVYIVCMFNAIAGCSILAVKHIPETDQDYIIIPGSMIKKDGTPTRLLSDRIDAALEFEKKQFAETGKHAIFVASGGKGSDEIMPEARSMYNYMLQKGIPADQIMIEDTSKTTKENIVNSEKLMNSKAKHKNVSIATTNYHLFRSLILAKKENLKCSGISGRTKWYFYPNGFVREFVAILVRDKKFHLFAVANIVIINLGFLGIQYLFTR